jgi:uncharacterized protein (TIGR03382 family)
VPASTMTLKDAVAIPVAGDTDLSYYDWAAHEGDDSMYVEISTDDGATWAELRHDQRILGSEEAAPAFVSEPMTQRVHSLAAYKGQSVKVRFRFQSGGEDRPASAPFGWYVDDIAITNDNWADLGPQVALTRTLVGQAVGARCYRVGSTYLLGGTPTPGPYSNIVPIEVKSTVIGGGGGGGGPLDEMGNNKVGGMPPLTLAMLGLLALGRRRRR